MKKLLSIFAAAAMLFGFASCSGDLQDDVKVDPNAMTGYWSYRVMNSADVPAGEVAVIANCDAGQTGAFGSPDFLVSAEAGTVNYLVWDGIGGTDFTVSTRTDHPEVELAEGEFAICVFTKHALINIYCYNTGATDDSWPGVPGTPAVALETVEFSIEGVTVSASGLPGELEGATLYFTGAFNGWVTPGAEGSIEVTVADGAVSVTLPALTGTAVVGAPQTAVVEGKFATEGWARPEVGVAEGNIKVTVSADAKTVVGTYVESVEHEENGLIYVCDWDVE